MNEKMIALKPGIEVYHKKKIYKYAGKRPEIPESVVIEILAAKLKNADKKELEKALKDWRKKYELTVKGADVYQNASIEGDKVSA
jgi:hypothetical protein